MEFNFRGWDAQLQHHMYPTTTPVKDGLLGGSRGGMGILAGSMETREAIQRELEKERIREEILAEEIARKRDLEAEVRREMAMEMAMHGGRGFPSSFTPRAPVISHANGLQPVMPPFVPPVSFQERFGGRCEIGGFNHRLIPVDGKKKVVDLGKPNGGAKGKPAIEWSCAVCKVSAPCEQAFKQHLAGKKHQDQMAALKASKAQKPATQHKKTSKKPSGEIGLGVKSTTTTTMETESSKSNKSAKAQPPPLMKKNSSKCDSKQEEDKKISKLWFSCEMCNVRASSHEVMNAHIKGKKHLQNLLKLHQESGAGAAGPGTKKPHDAKEKPEFGEEETQVAVCESIGSAVVDT